MKEFFFINITHNITFVSICVCFTSIMPCIQQWVISLDYVRLFQPPTFSNLWMGDNENTQQWIIFLDRDKYMRWSHPPPVFQLYKWKIYLRNMASIISFDLVKGGNLLRTISKAKRNVCIGNIKKMCIPTVVK